MALSSVLSKISQEAVWQESNGLTEPRAVEIENILKKGVHCYSRKSVERMLRNPTTMKPDSEGRLCLMYVNDGDSREKWIISATPVAMAVYLKLFSLAKKLLEQGFRYEPFARFQAFNIDGNMNDEERIFGHGSGKTSISKLICASHSIYMFNNISNFEVITCLQSNPRWVVDGIWDELSRADEEIDNSDENESNTGISYNNIFSNILKNMELYYYYTNNLCCISKIKGYETELRSGNFYYSKSPFSGDAILQDNTECFRRINFSLERLYKCKTQEGKYKNISIDSGNDYSADILNFDLFPRFNFIKDNNEDQRFYSEQSAQGKLIEDFYIWCIKIIYLHISEKRESVTVGFLEYWLDQYDDILGNKEPFSPQLLKSMFRLFNGNKKCEYLMIQYMYIQYVRSESRNNKEGRAFLKKLTYLINDQKISEARLFRDCLAAHTRIITTSNLNFPFIANSSSVSDDFDMTAVKEINNTLEKLTGKKSKPIILDGRIKECKDYLISELCDIVSTKNLPLCAQRGKNLLAIDMVINFDLIKDFSDGLNAIIKDNNPEWIIVFIKKGIINKTNAKMIMDRCMEKGGMKLIPYLLAIE